MNNTSTFITQIHDYIRSALTLRRGAFMRSDLVQRGTHKEYPRMPRIVLPKAEPVAMPLHEALHTRKSFSVSATERSLSLTELGTLLGNALGMRDETLRHYPSGGALYPIETYILGNVAVGYPSGVFHYHPKAHALEFLWETPTSFAMSNILRSPDIALAPQLIVFTSVWNRSGAKYGDHAYSHGLLEAGHMAENVLLVATALGMSTRPIAGYDDAALAKLLDLDERIEQSVYSIALCPAVTQQQ